MISIEQIKQLRHETAVSISECKKALEEANGDMEKAKGILRKKGKDLAGKKFGRDAKQGIIEIYIHPNKKIGVMIELCCETDFVAKSKDFQALAHEICLQVAAMNPLFLGEDDIPKEFLDKEKEIYKGQLKKSDKPKNIIEEIIKGKLNKRKKEICLIFQPWIKDETKSIKDLNEKEIAKIREKIVVKRFIRYEL